MNIFERLKEMPLPHAALEEAMACGTEREYWSACTEPGVLFWWAREAGVDINRLMLLACRCIREIPVGGRGALGDNLPEESLAALTTIERECRGEATAEESEVAGALALQAAWRSSRGNSPDLVKGNAATAVFILTTGDIQKAVHTAWYAAIADESTDLNFARCYVAEIIRDEVSWEEIEPSTLRNDVDGESEPSHSESVHNPSKLS